MTGKGKASIIITVIILGLVAYFFLCNSMQMTTFFIRNDDRMATITNNALSTVNSSSDVDITLKQEVCTDETISVPQEVRIKIKKISEDKWVLNAERKVNGSATPELIYFEGGNTSTGTIYLDLGNSNQIKITDKTINQALMRSSGGGNSFDASAAYFSSIEDFMQFATKTKEDMADFAASLLFSMSPFKVGVNYLKHTAIGEGAEYAEEEYAIAFLGKLYKYRVKEGTDQNYLQNSIIINSTKTLQISGIPANESSFVSF